MAVRKIRRVDSLTGWSCEFGLLDRMTACGGYSNNMYQVHQVALRNLGVKDSILRDWSACMSHCSAADEDG